MSIALLQQFWQAEDGQDMIEYALLLALIALAAVALLGGIGTSVNKIWSGINSSVSNAALQ
ncbi:MAG: Flp family type IVb pilin [Bryobacteraceae bacterium]